MLLVLVAGRNFSMRHGWTLMPSGRWTTTRLKSVGQYLALHAWIGGEWAITHKGERVAAWHDKGKATDLQGAMIMAEAEAENHRK